MVQCDQCFDWFHGRCMGITSKRQASKIAKYSCQLCSDQEADGSAAVRVAQLLDTSVEEILHQAMENSQQLYGWFQVIWTLKGMIVRFSWIATSVRICG